VTGSRIRSPAPHYIESVRPLLLVQVTSNLFDAKIDCTSGRAIRLLNVYV